MSHLELLYMDQLHDTSIPRVKVVAAFFSVILTLSQPQSSATTIQSEESFSAHVANNRRRQSTTH